MLDFQHHHTIYNMILAIQKPILRFSIWFFHMLLVYHDFPNEQFPGTSWTHWTRLPCRAFESCPSLLLSNSSRTFCSLLVTKSLKTLPSGHPGARKGWKDNETHGDLLYICNITYIMYIYIMYMYIYIYNVYVYIYICIIYICYIYI